MEAAPCTATSPRMPVTVLGRVRRDHAGVGDDDDVAVEPVAVLARAASSKFGEPDSSSPSIRNFSVTAGLRARRSAARCARSAEQVEQQLALVVGGTAGAQHVAVDGRVERVGAATARSGRRAARRGGRRRDGRRVRVLARPLGEHRRQPGGRPDLDGREAGARGRVGEPLGAAGDVAVVLGLGADAGDAQPLVEIVEQVLAGGRSTNSRSVVMLAT